MRLFPMLFSKAYKRVEENETENVNSLPFLSKRMNINMKNWKNME